MKLTNVCFGVLLLLIVGIQIVSAVTVSTPVINPVGDLTSGTPVNVSFKIDMTPVGGETFPKDNTLLISTDLNNPRWNATLVKNGINEPLPVGSGRSIYLTGWILSYPSPLAESVLLTLEGTVPTVTRTMNKSIVAVQELDFQNVVIPSSVITRDRLIVNPTDITQSITLRESDLQTFRTHIENKTQMGVNTTAAQQKLIAAQAAILAARSLDFSKAQDTLNNVTGLIDDGETLLDRAWAEKAINEAQATITQTTDQINYFTVNRSITNDPRLSIVVVKKESADQYLTSAKDFFNAGNYELARVKAMDAFNKGNESLNDAKSFRSALTNTSGTTSNGGVSWLNNTTIMIIVGVIVVILAIAAYALMRKKDRWSGQ